MCTTCSARSLRMLVQLTKRTTYCNWVFELKRNLAEYMPSKDNEVIILGYMKPFALLPFTIYSYSISRYKLVIEPIETSRRVHKVERVKQQLLP